MTKSKARIDKLEPVAEGARTRVSFTKMQKMCSQLGLSRSEIETMIRFNQNRHEGIEIDTPDATIARRLYGRGWDVAKIIDGGPWVRFKLPFRKLSFRSKDEPDEPTPDEIDEITENPTEPEKEPADW